MKLLLFSDLHLETPFRWAGSQAGRARRRRLRQVLGRIVELARREQVDAILCGGDLYEQERFTPETVESIGRAFEAARPIPVFIAPGNHDWYGPESLYRHARFSSNVHVFEEDRLRRVSLAEGITLWGAAHRAPANTDGFLDGFRVSGPGLHLALFHGSEGAFLARERAGKEPHAPFREDQIREAGLRHVFAGHYHCPVDTDALTYPGNPDPLEFGEEGPRGAVIATVSPEGQVTQRRVPVALSQVHDLPIDVSGCASVDEIQARVQEAIAGLEGIARVTLSGELARDVELRAADLEAPEHLEAFRVVVSPELRVGYDLDAIAAEATVRGQFVRDVLEDGELDEHDRRAVIVTGLRALEGREDLEAL
ncbi:MAG: metallophosphoesterase [Myxococcota bacterium]